MAMSLFEELVSDASIAMMRRVLCKECNRRRITQDSLQGEDQAGVVMNAFLAGIRDERELTVLVRNLVD
jgi:hypothetical protein